MAEARQRRQLPTIAYMHIPKTAGTSLVAHINSYGIRWHHVSAGVYYKEVDAFIGSYRHSLAAIRKDIKHGQFDLIFGHFTARDLIVGCGSSLVFRNATILREPTERLISEYFYSVSATHNGRDATLTRFPTIEAWVFENTETEVMCRFLEEYRGEKPEQIADRLVEDFAFVGLTDAIEDSFRAFSDIFGKKLLVKAAALNTNPSKRIDIGDSLMEALRQRNARDVELYARVASRIRRRLASAVS